MASVIAHGAGAYQDTVTFADAYLADMSGRATGVYANFLGDEAPSRLHAAYPGATYERLVQVKRRVDPDNVFHANHNIRPD
jgi:FAD/FMN-containing dehydrogenase